MRRLYGGNSEEPGPSAKVFDSNQGSLNLKGGAGKSRALVLARYWRMSLQRLGAIV
jgi:hypothetical protein